jgi:hypothetical protein
MRWKIVALVVVISLLVMPRAFAEKRAIKATTPVEVSIYPVTSVDRGQASTFIVRATSSMPSDNIVIDVLPTAGSQVLSGALHWQGAVVPGVAKELSFTLLMAGDQVPSVSVTSSIEFAGEQRFAATATYRQETQMPEAFHTISRERKVLRKGRQVIEYRVK